MLVCIGATIWPSVRALKRLRREAARLDEPRSSCSRWRAPRPAALAQLNPATDIIDARQRRLHEIVAAGRDREADGSAADVGIAPVAQLEALVLGQSPPTGQGAGGSPGARRGSSWPRCQAWTCAVRWAR